MENYRYLNVLYNDILVGKLAKTNDNLIAFEYDDNWLNNGFSISPYSLQSVYAKARAIWRTVWSFQ